MFRKRAPQKLRGGYKKAERILKSEDKTEEFLRKAEKKLRRIPFWGKRLALVPTMISMVRSYLKKEYPTLPMNTVVALISALLYFVVPVDMIVDVIPFAGYLDDAAVLAACYKLVKKDIDAYLVWRDRKDDVIPV